MPLLQDLYNMGEPDVPFNRQSVDSAASLSFDTKWRVTETDKRCIVGTVGALKTSGNEDFKVFIDNAEYTFGVEITEVKKDTFVAKATERARIRHANYIEAIKKLDLEKSEPLIKSLIDFLSNDPYGKLIEGWDDDRINKLNQAIYGSSAGIRIVNNKGEVLAEKYADKINGYTQSTTRCSISGDIEPIMHHNLEKLSRMHGTTSSGVVMLCSNSDKYQSLNNYGFDKLEGSPMSATSYSRVLRNMQTLLSDNKTNIRIPNSRGVSYLVKYDNVANDDQIHISTIIASPVKANGYDDEDTSDETISSGKGKVKKEFKTPAQIVYEKYCSVQGGEPNRKDGMVKKRSSSQIHGHASGYVTLYRIHGAQGRWSCTGEYRIDVNTLFANIDKWYSDTVQKRAKHDSDHVSNDSNNTGAVYTIYNLLASINAKNEKVLPHNYENLVHAALFGKPISQTIFRKALTRIFAQGHAAWDNQCALIRACYNNIARMEGTKEITSMLDTTNTSFAYNLGRLLAVADYMQRNANKNVEVCVSDKLLSRAKRRPLDCYNELNDRIARYRTQVARKNPGAMIYGNKMLDEIIDHIEPAKSTPLTPQEQALLIQGKSSQNSYIYTKNETTNNKD